MLTDNSLYYSFSSSKSRDQFTTPHKIYDRTFNHLKGEKPSRKMTDYLTLTSDPFSFKIHDPIDQTKEFFSSADILNVFHSDITAFTIAYPQTGGLFFGLGERAGKFYLEDKKTYHLFASNEDPID
jgi:hypothetical protein